MTEKVILVGVGKPGENTEASLLELQELLKTADAESVGTVIQNREAIHPGTYIGKGKIEEVKDLIRETEATGIVCDDELSPAQMSNLSELLDTKVMDRTVVILDIFASHARTSEGKIQVELAQHRYQLTRLSGYGRDMSRLGGGIGTRGPGETKLETDRRRIRQRITTLKQELRELQKQRELRRVKREKNHIPVAAIVGYTNAGKSTLLNALTGANVLSEDKLFATLDPTTRSFILPLGENILLTDTVGFIRKLPHHLIDAFRSTLEEAKYADFLIHVVDSADPDYEDHMAVVYETLRELQISGKPILTLFNKCDLAESTQIFRDSRADRTLRVSAKTGEGLSEVAECIQDFLRESRIYFEHCYDFKDAGKIQLVRKYGQLISEEYTAQGILVKAWIPKIVIQYVNGKEGEQ